MMRNEMERGYGRMKRMGRGESVAHGEEAYEAQGWVVRHVR